jgi:hypothetical protein
LNGLSPTLWHDPDGLRIWRCPDSDFYGDEVAEAAEVYTGRALAAIADEGFNAIWLRGRLRDLAGSNTLPGLRRPGAAPRLASLNTVIQRAAQRGVGVYLFFNEPLAPTLDDPFWDEHPDLGGETHPGRVFGEPTRSLCTSHPTVQRHLAESAEALLAAAAGLAGLILITATEYPTHCWSHHMRFPIDDGERAREPSPPIQCPRCLRREPADIVVDLLTLWRDAAKASSSSPRVLCWNWSWSIWYPEPQAQILQRLPDGVELLADFERGTSVQRLGRTLPIDEYSLTVVGPSERFLASMKAVRNAGVPIHAKLQLGTTHEIATVPNLPLITRLHAKLRALSHHQIAGFMGTWNFGGSFTLNTAAVRQYLRDPERYRDADCFLPELAENYFGPIDTESLLSAWEGFAHAWDRYPFSIRMLYLGPLNRAPAFIIDLEYHAQPLGDSWLVREAGQRLEDSLGGGLTLAETADAYGAMAERWDAALSVYANALSPATPEPDQQRHRVEELACARIIGVQLQSCANIFRFGVWRARQMQTRGVTAPCTLQLDGEGRDILEQERQACGVALSLAEADPRLGYHQECQAYLYEPATIRIKLEKLDQILGGGPCI